MELSAPTNNFDVIANSEPSHLQSTEVLLITNDSAKEIFINFVNSDCCYGKKTALECEIIQVTPSNAYDVSIIK